MPMGQTSLDCKALLSNHMVLTSQGLTDDLNGLGGEIGQIGQGLVLYLAILAIGAPKEMGLIDLVLVLATSSGNMHGTAKAFHQTIVTPKPPCQGTRVYTFSQPLAIFPLHG